MAQDLRIALRDLPIGGKAQVADGDATVLFVRDENGVRAFQAKCPHYGAPLAKGEVCGTTLYCPWHKAAFDIGDGSLVEPPALEGLDRYPVRIEGEHAIATFAPIRSSVPERDAQKSVVVVGAGAAAVATITTLRREGFAGTITMISPEAGAPYDRPKLSKNFLAKKTAPDAMRLDPAFNAAQRVNTVVGRALSIDPATRRVTLEDGTIVVGDAVLVATGSRAVVPDLPGRNLPGVFTLRSLDDAVAISTAAERAKRVVVIGGGFIGLEAAAFLTKRGLNVTVVSPEALPLAGRFGKAVAAGLKRYHEKSGIHFVQGKTATIAGDAQVDAVVLESGESLPADMVLLAIGAKPEVPEIVGATSRDDGGYNLDDMLRIAPDIYLAGDIAAFAAQPETPPVRIEHWRVAQQHGMHAARAMLGARAPFSGTPYFWSNQGDKRLDYVGHAKDWDQIVMCGDAEALDFIAYYIKGNQAVAACAIGHNPALIAFLHRLDEGRAPDLAELEASGL